MSDTSNPTNLASVPLAGAAEFDARLQRTDEDRWLATRYAAPAARELLVAIYLLNQELQRTLHTKEPMLGKILGMAGRLAREQGLTDGFRTVINNGRVGRQEVYHLHMHVLGGPDPLRGGQKAP